MSTQSDARFTDSPIVWFAEMLIALDRRDIDRAAEAKRQLARLGWVVKGCKPRTVRTVSSPNQPTE
jgi:hypothetical protein